MTEPSHGHGYNLSLGEAVDDHAYLPGHTNPAWQPIDNDTLNAANMSAASPPSVTLGEAEYYGQQTPQDPSLNTVIEGDWHGPAYGGSPPPTTGV